jgi:hypothetical protein
VHENLAYVLDALEPASGNTVLAKFPFHTPAL